MKIQYGKGKTKYGTGIDIELSPRDIVRAISAYLVAKGLYVSGPLTYTINGDLIPGGNIYVDPSGFVILKGRKIKGGKALRCENPPKHILDKLISGEK